MSSGLLTLTRKVGESVTISDENGLVCIVYLTRVKGQQVRLTVKAKKTIKVQRSDNRKDLKPDIN